MVLAPYGLSENEVQVEVVRVTTDLANELHYHQKAHAHVIVMGSAENVDEPVRAQGYIEGVWSPVVSSQVIDIPPGTKHGFTVGEQGVLWFLSVQSPPIVDDSGQDDYHKLN